MLLDSHSSLSMAVRRAQRVAAARLLADTAADWRTLDACPDWATASAPAQQALAAHTGACWLADALRACIDGKRLAAVSEAIGGEALHALLKDDGAPMQAPPPRPWLPEPADCAAHLQSCGRALLAWSLPASLRALVPAALGWPPVPETQLQSFDHHADWARHAVQSALENVQDSLTHAEATSGARVDDVDDPGNDDGDDGDAPADGPDDTASQP